MRRERVACGIGLNFFYFFLCMMNEVHTIDGSDSRGIQKGNTMDGADAISFPILRGSLLSV